MADHDLSIIVRAKGAVQAARDIGKVDSAVGRLSGHASRGIKSATRNVALIGVGAALAIGTAAKSGIESLAELEDATTQVDGAIEQMGKSGKITSGQIATWANEIESSVEAAFDDKEIVAATATLIRFGKVTTSNIRPAMEVITDLATKTGSVESAANLLGKALADPTKASGKLARQGIILTKAEEKQIKAFVKAGDIGKAQAVVLDAVAKSTKGAAKASAGPYRDSLNILADVSEDAQRALGEGFLPVIQKVSKLLSGELAKPSTIQNIRAFGQGLAEGLDSAINIARNLPWGAMGDALKVAGAGGKALLGAFQSMPPWVQTAILTGWGLNKLTGGALGGIVGELGKGLIKGVLSMNAGVVHIKAGAVTGGGGVAPGGKGGKGGGIAGIASVFIAGAAIGFLAELRGQQSAENRAGAAALTTKTNEFVKVAGVPAMQNALNGILEYDRKLSTSTDILNAEVVAFQMNIDGVRDSVREQEAKLTQEISAGTTAVENMKGTVKTSVDLGASTSAAASLSAGATTASAIATQTGQIVSAIRANRTQVNVSPTTILRTVNIQERTGSSSGSRNSGGGAFGGH